MKKIVRIPAELGLEPATPDGTRTILKWNGRDGVRLQGCRAVRLLQPPVREQVAKRGLRFAQSVMQGGQVEVSIGHTGIVHDGSSIRVNGVEFERQYVTNVVHGGRYEIIGRRENDRALGVLVQDREILQVRIAVLDGARERHHGESYIIRGG